MVAPILRLNKDTQNSLVHYAQIVLDLHKRQSTYRDKMEFIDIAYARHKVSEQDASGTDTGGAAEITCGINAQDIVVPIVVSQVDAYVGYFAEVFLSGFPMFPVVSNFANKDAAEMLESIIDDHSVRGRYPRQLLMSFRDDAKYNFSAVEVDWKPLNIYNVTDAITQLGTKGAGGQNKLSPETFYINALNRWDPYNTIWDYRCHPVDVPYNGEYAGHLEVISRVELKRRLAYYGATGDGYNTAQVLSSKLGHTASGGISFEYYKELPQISHLIANKDIHRLGLTDWVSYLDGRKQRGSEAASNWSDVYEHLTLYVRIIPNEHGMDVPNKGTPQVWKFCYINHDRLVYAKRIYSLYDMIPVFMSQPFEDGFGMQTKSLAENAAPFQEAASDLFSIRMNAARRAVVDRAIYDPKALNSKDVNAPYASAKIPLRDGQTLAGKKLSDVYHQIPFDSRGTETVIQDMNHMIAMADQMNGTNQGMQGQHVKGNKTRKQWDDTQEGAKNRMRLPAVAIEHQKMLPIREQIKLNIYQYGVDGTFTDMSNGKTHEINRAKLQEIREKVGVFKLADGYTPAEKVASTDVLVEGMKFISQSPKLQEQLGPMLPAMFMHFMSLSGVKGLDQYMPQQAAQGPAQSPQAPAGPPLAPPGPIDPNTVGGA